MIKEVKYNGFSATPSDYECSDGDLACAMGVIPEDGALRPVPPPTTILSLNSGEWVVKIHTTPVFEHYLILDSNNRLYWRTKDSSLKTLMADFVGREILQVECIGNTVLVLCDNGIHYLLWKAYGQNYTSLGNKLPECPISFGLQGTLAESNSFNISYNSLGTTTLVGTKFSDENKSIITEQVLAQVNAFVAEKATNSGRFMFPFFVRYAYRLYDGSLTHHSSPILMLPTTYVNPIVIVNGTVGDKTSSLKVVAVAADLDYQPIADADTLSEITLWGDIIKSVDIFISAPIYTYDQSGEVEQFSYGAANGSFYGKFDDGNSNTTDYYGINLVSDLYKTKTGQTINYSAALPAKNSKDIYNDIADCGQFYYLTSIEIGNLLNERNKLVIPDNYLESLVTRELMTDDYQTHDSLRPKTMFVYNNRINIANVEREMFKGYDTASMVGYIERTDSVTTKEKMHLYTSLNTSDGNYMVKNSSSLALAQDSRVFRYLYYPDTTATGIMARPTGLDGYKEVNGINAFFAPFKKAPLKPHAFLNGAVYFEGFGNDGWDSPFSGYTLQEDTPIISTPNKIYTSEVNNPFYFPLSGINTIGTGEIIGMSTAAKALSEGQFGQFPLYAFTTDGVWAMEVSNTGAFSARQPITRDVCLNRESITPIDNAVLFLTDRGVMLMSGSNSSCISNILDSKLQFTIRELPYAEQMMSKAGIPESAFDVIPFKEYIHNARMLYDYVNQRVILFNPNRSYAYVYSLESKAWGMMNANIASGVNSYPEAMAMTTDSKFVDFSEASVTKGFKGLLVTRPMKLDAPNILKTVEAVIQRGQFKKGSVKTILYGSRDLCEWYLIASSKDHYLNGFFGTPYKYFRLALICDLSNEESIYGCSVQFSEKQTNNLR